MMLLPFVLREKENKTQNNKNQETKKSKHQPRHNNMNSGLTGRYLAKDHLFDLFCSVQVRSSMREKQIKSQKTKMVKNEG